jgi:hypothetical protein
MPHDHCEERRLLLPAARPGHPDHGSGDPAFGVPQLGVVGAVAGEADAGLGHGVPLPVAWPGGLPCPWTRGDPEGDKRSVTEIVADEVEASLK